MEYVIGAIIVVALYFYIKNKMDTEKRLKRRYEEALKGTDKKVALDAGRAYFGHLRQGKKLTMHDEQTISNDMAAMNT